MEMDFDEYIEANNQAMGQLVLMSSNMNEMIKKVKDESVKSAIDASSIMYGELKDAVALLSKDNELFKSELKDTKVIVKKLESDYANITQTFLMNPSVKRKFDKYISSLTYSYTIKDSICDRLFHGDITRTCKGHIVKSLDVNSVGFIKADDFETTKVLAKKFFKSNTIKDIIKKKLISISVKDNSQAGLKQEVKALYDAYLDETDGGINIYV